MLRLGNEAPVKIHQIHNVLGNASHHYIIYKVPESAVGEGEYHEPRTCESLVNLLDPSKSVPLMITQKREETLTLPDGVAFELEANQMLLLELHYINASDVEQNIEVTSTFIPIAESEFEHAADFLFVGNIDVEVPPRESVSLNTYLPIQPDLAGVRIFGVTGHQHQWGTDVSVSIAADRGGPDTTIYDLDEFRWDEPETVHHDPPVILPEGGGFRFTCEWFNAGERTATFGEGVNDEMCFFWAYYYPSQGARVCAHTEQTGVPLDVCCPGDALCGVIQVILDQLLDGD